MWDGTHLIMVGRSQLIPHPSTLTFFGIPIGSNISGLKIPDYEPSVSEGTEPETEQESDNSGIASTHHVV